MTDHYTPKPDPATPAGATLNAVDALRHADTFTRAQVAHLIHLAYLSGGHARTALDIAELRALHHDQPDPRTIRAQRVAARTRALTDAAARQPPPPRYWPTTMTGGWPLPPELPDDAHQWPEVDGWPCPPPELRGPAA
jgi:hypothetical protein